MRFKLAFLLFLFSTAVSPQTIGGSHDVSVLSGSASTAAAFSAAVATYPFALMTPAVGTTIEIRYLLGGATVAALVTSPVLPLHGICLNIGPDGYISTWGISGTATLHITQYTKCPQGIGF